ADDRVQPARQDGHRWQRGGKESGAVAWPLGDWRSVTAPHQRSSTVAAADAYAGRGRDDYCRRSCGPDRLSATPSRSRAAILPYPDDRQLGWVVTAASAPVWEETLRDGRVVALRPLGSDDAAEVEALWRRLDAPSRRLFTNLAHLPPD